MPYTIPTLADAATALASRLNDPSNVRWTLSECYDYLREALRTWSVWTQHWRNQAVFTTTVDQAFYDLSTVLSPILRGQTVTNWQLVASLQAALLEPVAAGGTWTGTDQFTLAQLTTAIQRRRDQFLRETGAILTRTVTNYASPISSGRFGLDESVLSVRRAAWRDTATQRMFPLLVTDEWSGTNYQPRWPVSTAPPQWYSVSVTPPISLQVMPPPTAAGDLDLVSLNKGAIIDPLVASSLGIPDDYAWIIKYGALSDLLNGDGLALDPQRAAYCEMRWQQGLDVVRRNSVVLSAPYPINSLSEADRYSPTWFLVSGVPHTLLLAGQNLVALWPPPGTTGGPWTISLDVVQNAPIPLIPTDILQVSQDVYDSILDLAQHAALFKEGPGQTELATALLDRAARAAGIENRFQQASQPARGPMLGQTAQDRRAVAEQRDVVATSSMVEG